MNDIHGLKLLLLENIKTIFSISLYFSNLLMKGLIIKLNIIVSEKNCTNQLLLKNLYKQKYLYNHYKELKNNLKKLKFSLIIYT